jgi:hypothetical protein
MENHELAFWRGPSLHADGALDTSTGTFRILLSNTGDTTAAFHVRSALPADLPRCYTVEPGKTLTVAWRAATGPTARCGHATNRRHRGLRW